MPPQLSERIPVYFMPGMAASPLIFSNIFLSEDRFETHFLDWFIPEKGMSFRDYAREMCQRVVHPNPVLIGVSFGGLLVQEMGRLIKVRRIIIISSVKCTSELPAKMLFARYTHLHKFLPTGLVNNVELLSRYAFGERVGKRLELYEKYLSIRDKHYIDWSIDKIVNWKQATPLSCLVHIHGEKDTVFPIQNIKDCITVKNGTHTMIIHRYKWFNERLPAIILEDRSCI